jgi:hypothetical protein
VRSPSSRATLAHSRKHRKNVMIASDSKRSRTTPCQGGQPCTKPTLSSSPRAPTAACASATSAPATLARSSTRGSAASAFTTGSRFALVPDTTGLLLAGHKDGSIKCRGKLPAPEPSLAQLRELAQQRAAMALVVQRELRAQRTATVPRTSRSHGGAELAARVEGASQVRQRAQSQAHPATRPRARGQGSCLDMVLQMMMMSFICSCRNKNQP